MSFGVTGEGVLSLLCGNRPTPPRTLRLVAFSYFLVFLFLHYTYTPVAAAPIPVSPVDPQAPSVPRFPLKRDALDPPRLLLLHDIEQKNATSEEAKSEALAKARAAYSVVFKYIEEIEQIEVVALPLFSPLRLFYFGEAAFQFILIIAEDPQQVLPAESITAILEWLDAGGEESQGAHSAYHQHQHLLPQQQQQQQKLQQQQFYSPVERSRSLLLLLGPKASPSLLQLAAAAFGTAALTASFLQQNAADLFNAVSVRLKEQQQQQQQVDGKVFIVREVIDGHPHIVTPLAEDEVVVYTGGYHMGALQIGCGIRGCSKEPLPTQAFPLLLAPPTAFPLSSSSSTRSSSSSSSSNSTRMALASALQTRNNSRVLLLSGPASCSTAFTSLKTVPFATYDLRVVNRRFCEEAVGWALNRRGVLRWSNVKHHKVGDTKNSSLYTLGTDLRFSVDLHELRNGKLKKREKEDLGIEYTLGNPMIRRFLQKADEEGATFFAEFRAPDRHGIFKFVFRYARLGYSSLFFQSLAPLRVVRTDEAERFHPMRLERQRRELLSSHCVNLRSLRKGEHIRLLLLSDAAAATALFVLLFVYGTKASFKTNKAAAAGGLLLPHQQLLPLSEVCELLIASAAKRNKHNSNRIETKVI
ncbi:hypothetical protein Esti_003640 [Eimeria stiedai]